MLCLLLCYLSCLIHAIMYDSHVIGCILCIFIYLTHACVFACLFMLSSIAPNIDSMRVHARLHTMDPESLSKSLAC